MAYDDDDLLDDMEDYPADGDEYDDYGGGNKGRHYNYDENDYEYDSGDDEEGYEDEDY